MGQGQPELMRWILVLIMPHVQNHSPDLLTCSPARYHCATTALFNKPHPTWTKVINHCSRGMTDWMYKWWCFRSWFCFVIPHWPKIICTNGRGSFRNHAPDVHLFVWIINLQPSTIHSVFRLPTSIARLLHSVYQPMGFPSLKFAWHIWCNLKCIVAMILKYFSLHM